MLSACSAVAQATDCQVADETTMLQGLRMESGSVARQQKRMKTTDAKGLDAKHLLKSLQNVAHNLDTMSTEEVDLALAEAADALATLSPAIQEQVEILQNAVLHAAAAVESCHVQEGVEQRASLWDAAEQQAGEVATCEAELATAVADEAQICSAASVADVQSECACNEATARREDKEELCAAILTAYEFAYCEHNLQCNTYQDCHETETAVYNQVRDDVDADMGPVELEYIAAQQSTCIMGVIQANMLAGEAMDFVAIAACSAVDTSPLLLVYPDLPAAPEACPAATTGSPVCAHAAAYSHVHGGHCAGGWLGGNTMQADADACSAHCRTVANCHYFAFCADSTHAQCTDGSNCALYNEAAGCPDDDNWGAYEAYVNNPLGQDCAPALLGNDDSSSAGVPDGAAAIQFIDLSFGSFGGSGKLTSVSYYVARANQAGMKFQIYRPVSGNTYHLVSESETLASPSTGRDSHTLATPLDYQAGDYIGWVHTGQGTFPFTGAGGSVRWRYGIMPVGSDIDFNGAGTRTYAYRAGLLMC